MTSDAKRPLRLKGIWTVFAVVLLGWAMFSYGLLFSSAVDVRGGPLFHHTPVVVILLAAWAWFRRDHWWPWLTELLERHTDAIDDLPNLRIGLWIAVAAGLGLYTELMMIRLHSSYFQLFAYFKNVSLLSCFLGLGIGYTLAARRPLLTPLVLPALAAQVLVMQFLRVSGLAESLQSPVSEELGFGIPYGGAAHPLAAYGFLIAVFAFNALCFVPLGQLASRLMSRQSKLISYSWNLLGSLAGIFLFYLMAYMWAPPSLWLFAAFSMLLLFLRRQVVALLSSAVAALTVVAVVGVSPQVNELDLYSPYQVLTLLFRRSVPLELRVNHVYYQRVLNLDSTALGAEPSLRRWERAYSLPYHFQPAPERVLVVGAGTGNDVAAAVRAGASEIDAVEIDPAILQLGRLLHPESPYQAKNVNAVVADARSYIRHTSNQYDLIVYGLLDSHTLLSGKAGVRLDSYVYTVEAFREARAKLRAGGLISLTFSLITPELGRKLYLMLQEAFDGEPPVVYRTGYDQGFTFIIGNDMAARRFQPFPELQDFTPFFGLSKLQVDLSTDDWPFFYMPVRKYPASYVVMILILLTVSLIFIRQTVPGSGRGLSGPCFFLGAGFMLVETKGITELALAYGTTWTVIGAVITGILVMAFLANLIVMRVGAPAPVITYGFLLLSLLAGLAITSERLGSVSPWLGGVILTVALTLPLFFSGFAFSTELAKSPSVAVALSSNLLGAMLGGFLEYNSMYFGFRFLYVLAFIMYFLAFLLSLRSRASVSPAVAAT